MLIVQEIVHSTPESTVNYKKNTYDDADRWYNKLYNQWRDKKRQFKVQITLKDDQGIIKEYTFDPTPLQLKDWALKDGGLNKKSNPP